ncbi:MAG: hypothetical protein KJZ85_05085 [Rhodobacteraceae bacterium]|jgi:hypothetical protein|nr:hypothetical protein [Paracoccaceae bacterium]
MISLDDIQDMAGLTREEIAAIAEHEHLAPANAALLSEYLLHVHHGPQRVQRMICEDIRTAIRGGDAGHARALFAALRHFMAEHPEAERGND